ncbi:MAG: YraN family protein [Candidatus Nomurabacteria bacterium]|jgi:Holliday junction resolvase-like predicted endonuclease|nr:YraN family protein [Candidatus Nomurabacteria bacterium]
MTTSYGQTKKNTTQIGNRGESAVVSYLESHKHKVIARNWRTKFCEIDIISLARNPAGEVEIYFTEVKMRKTGDFGGGLSAISPTKLRQMHRAAEFFLLKYPKFRHLQPLLAAADVAADYAVQDFFVIT